MKCWILCFNITFVHSLMCRDLKYVYRRINCCSTNLSTCIDLKSAYRNDATPNGTCCAYPVDESFSTRFQTEQFFANAIFETGFQMSDTPPQGEVVSDVRLFSITENQVTLQVLVDKYSTEFQSGTYLLRSQNASVIVGNIISQNESFVTRAIITGSQHGTFNIGDVVEVNADVQFVEGVPQRIPERVNNIYTPDLFGLQYEEIVYTSDVGNLRAHLTTQGDKGVIIWVHGFNGRYNLQGLGLRIATHNPDYKMMIIALRNDIGEPTSGRGIATYGVTEFQDVKAAVDYAHTRFGLPIFLFGVSGGASPVAVFDAQENDNRVKGIIYDGPNANFRGSVKNNGAIRFPFVDPALFDGFIAFTETLYDINFDDYDHRELVIQSRKPTLMYHYDLDSWNSPADYDYIIKRRNEEITYVPFENTGHVVGYLRNNTKYLSALATFLDAHI